MKNKTIRGIIKHVEKQEVLRIDDADGREYMWDSTKLYRLIPLKSKPIDFTTNDYENQE